MLLKMFSISIIDEAYLNMQAELPSVDQCLQEAHKLKRQSEVSECVLYFLLSNSPELGLDAGVEAVKSQSCFVVFM